MQAYVISRPLKGEIIEIDTPKPKRGWVLVKVTYAGVCGTDVHIFRGEVSVPLPLVPGHEFSGVVEEVGEGVDGLEKGDKVTVDPNVSCGKCYYCRRGMSHFCEYWWAVGVHRQGAFAEYVAVPQRNIYKLPDKLSLRAAALTEPLSCCIHGQDRAEIKHGDTVLILGAGPIGLLHLQLARLRGAADIIVADIVDWKLSVAERLGADLTVNPAKESLAKVVREYTGGRGVNVAIEAAGSVEAFKAGLKALDFGGTLVVFGVAPESAVANLRPFEVYAKELKIVGAKINPYTTERALKLLSSGKIKVDELVTHEISLEELPAYMEKLAEKKLEALKVLVRPS